MAVPASVKPVRSHVAFSDQTGGQPVGKRLRHRRAIGTRQFHLHDSHQRIIELSLLAQSDIPEGNLATVRGERNGTMSVRQARKKASDVRAFWSAAPAEVKLGIL